MDQYKLFLLLVPFAFLASVGIGFYCWRHRKVVGARSLTFVMGGTCGLIVFNTLELISPTPQSTLIFAKLSYPFIATISLMWLSFALDYSGQQEWIRKNFGWLYIIPVITILLVLTNEWHHLIWRKYEFATVTNFQFMTMRVTEYGTWFWVFWLQAFIISMAGAAILIWSSLSTQQRTYHRQSYWAVAGCLIPLIVNSIYVMHLIPGFRKDFSPIAYAMGGVLFAVGIFRYKLFSLMPLGRSILIEQLDDAMLILDTDRRVVDYNPAASRVLQKTQQVELGAAGEFFYPYLDKLNLVPGRETYLTEAEIPFEGGHEHFDMRLQRLKNRQGELIGFLITMHNITEYQHLLDVARHLATFDPLTNVLNRRSFMELANQEVERAHRNRNHFSLIALDVDSFKQINDTSGHKVGDKVLKELVGVLHQSLRGSDIIARFGGDEFFILLPESDLAASREIANRLCDQISKNNLMLDDGENVRFTVSMGVAEFEFEEDQSIDQLIELADRAMYAAKTCGRNQVCIAAGGKVTFG